MTTATSTLEKIPFTFPLEILKQVEVKEEFHVVGYAATSDFDLQGDVISDEALKNSSLDLLSNSTVLLNHDVKKAIGKVTKAEFDKHGLLIDVLISKTEPEIIQKIREGVLNKFSIRGQVLERTQEYRSDLDRVVNVIKRMALVEVSLVSVPANHQARAIGWYIKKALDNSNGAHPNSDENNSGGHPMSNEQVDIEEISNTDKATKKAASDPTKEIKKQDEPKPTPKENNPGQPTPEPKPQQAPAPNPSSSAPPQETQKNLQEVLRVQLDPIFMKLKAIMEMGGDAAKLAQDIWAMLKMVLGEPATGIPAVKPAPSDSPNGEMGKLISEEVKKQLGSALSEIPTLRKGFIQPETESADIRKTFDNLPPEKKLKVALAMQQA